MSMLICQDCGKAFLRKSKKGMAPKQCDECKVEKQRERARLLMKKRKALREKVVAKQKAYTPPPIPRLPRIPRMKKCDTCGERKPTSEYESSTDGRRVRCCIACNEKRLQKKLQRTCYHCREKKHVSMFSEANARICKECMDLQIQKKQEMLRERKEADEFILALMRKRQRRKEQLSLKQSEARMTERARMAKELGMDYGSYVAMLRRQEMENEKGI